MRASPTVAPNACPGHAPPPVSSKSRAELLLLLLLLLPFLMLLMLIGPRFVVNPAAAALSLTKHHKRHSLVLAVDTGQVALQAAKSPLLASASSGRTFLAKFSQIGRRVQTGMDTNSTARIGVKSDRRAPVEISPSSNTRKTYVTCDNRTCLATNVVLTSIASFLRDRVFPIVGEQCRINLHWDGIDLASLHVQSVIPDNYILVPRTTTTATADLSGDCGRTPNFACTINRCNGDATPFTTTTAAAAAAATTTLSTHNISNGGLLSAIKMEKGSILCNGGEVTYGDRQVPNSPVIANGQHDIAKPLSEPRIIITRNGESNMSGTVSLLNPGKQLPSIRAKPLAQPASQPQLVPMEQPSPLLLPTPPDMLPHSLCIPQATSAQSIIPLVPVMTYIQPHMTLGQVGSQHATALLPSAAVPITQMHSIQTLHQVATAAPVYTTGQILHSSQPASQAYTVQPLTVSVPTQRVQTAPIRTSAVTPSDAATVSASGQMMMISNGCRSRSSSLVKKIVRGPASLLQQPIKLESADARLAASTPTAAVTTGTRQIRVTPKRCHTSAVKSQILTKGGRVVLRAGSQISCKRLPSEGQNGAYRGGLDNSLTTVTAAFTTVATTTANSTVTSSNSSIIRRTKSPRLTRVSIVAHGQDDEPPVVYPALGSQPLETLFDTL